MVRVGRLAVGEGAGTGGILRGTGAGGKGFCGGRTARVDSPGKAGGNFRKNRTVPARLREYLAGMKTILVPVDFSSVTTRVCDAACALARSLKARVVLFHVIEPVPAMVNDYAMPMQDLDYLIDQAQVIANRKMIALGRRAAARRVRVLAVQRTGKPVPTILAKAAELKADYVVIGSQGHTAAYDLLIGSVLQGVLRRVACPVLVVPAPRRARR